jgi:hypothetical protein
LTAFGDEADPKTAHEPQDAVILVADSAPLKLTITSPDVPLGTAA